MQRLRSDVCCQASGEKEAVNFERHDFEKSSRTTAASRWWKPPQARSEEGEACCIRPCVASSCWYRCDRGGRNWASGIFYVRQHFRRHRRDGSVRPLGCRGSLCCCRHKFSRVAGQLRSPSSGIGVELPVTRNRSGRPVAATLGATRVSQSAGRHRFISEMAHRNAQRSVRSGRLCKNASPGRQRCAAVSGCPVRILFGC